MTGPQAAADPLGDALVAGGLAPSAFVLDLNGTLTAPAEFRREAPWDLPSRLFQFPVEVSPAWSGKPRRIGLLHPLLADHPFVRHVEAVMGFPIAPGGAPNDAGYSRRGIALWWHAVDLVAGHWRDLLDTRRFTTDDSIAGAVEFALHCRAQRFGLEAAHAVMRGIGAAPPEDYGAVLRCLHPPSSCAPEPNARGKRGAERWPVNFARDADGHARAWAMIVGLGRGWLRHDRSGHAEWTEAGRAAFARGAAAPSLPARARPAPPRLGGRQLDLFA